MLEVGSRCPEFSMPTADGSEISLKSLLGKNFVLYFYPKDDTPGCTTEAIGFSELIPEFEATNTVIVGVSKDTPVKHGRFIDKHNLKVILGSDESGEVCKKFGVWVKKKLYGREYMGIERATYLIDESGIIKNIWRRVKVKGHVDAVLNAAGNI